MTALIVIGAILLLFLFLLTLKVTLTVAYRDEITLSVKVLFLRIRLLPKKEKKLPRSMSAAQARRLQKKMKKQAAKKAAKKAEKKKAKEERKQEGITTQKGGKKKKSIREILDTVAMIREIVSVVIHRFFKHLRVDMARIKIKVATNDAATTAIAYGAVTQSVNLLLPLLNKIKHLDLPKVGDIDVSADFLSDSPEADVKLSFSLRVWHMLHVAIGALFTFIKHLVRKQTKNR